MWDLGPGLWKTLCYYFVEKRECVNEDVRTQTVEVDWNWREGNGLRLIGNAK